MGSGELRRQHLLAWACLQDSWQADMQLTEHASNLPAPSSAFARLLHLVNRHLDSPCLHLQAICQSIACI
jgi:hypothetical protein